MLQIKKLPDDSVLNWSESNINFRKPICDINLCNKSVVFDMFSDVFSKNSFDIGLCIKHRFSVRCSENVSLNLPSRRIPMHLQSKVTEMIHLLLKMILLSYPIHHIIHRLSLYLKKMVIYDCVYIFVN